VGSVPAFKVNKGGSNQTITANTPTRLTWSTEEFDTNNNFVPCTTNCNSGSQSASESRFTPTVAGKYQFNANVYSPNSPGDSYSIVYLVKNSGQSGSATTSAFQRTTQDKAVSVSTIFDMNGTTDYVEVFFYSGDTTVSGDQAGTTFSGSLISSTSSSLTANGGGGQLLAVYATSSAGTSTINFNGASSTAPSFSNGVLTLPSNTSYIIVKSIGGGGGGGGSTGGESGGGGGGGGMAQKLIINPNGNYYFTVGRGGSGASGSAEGSDGGASCFGTNGSNVCASPTFTANGGTGGTRGAFGGAGGVGGTASGGDINIRGSSGGGGTNAATYPFASGGASPV
jgi:hypothetical protein